MPTYAMNVFQLPNMWCADINTMIARFWWGAQNGNRKMHRRKWNTMIIQKREGATASETFMCSEKALLATTATRMMNESNAIRVKVVKAI